MIKHTTKRYGNTFVYLPNIRRIAFGWVHVCAFQTKLNRSIASCMKLYSIPCFTLSFYSHSLSGCNFIHNKLCSHQNQRKLLNEYQTKYTTHTQTPTHPHTDDECIWQTIANPNPMNDNKKCRSEYNFYRNIDSDYLSIEWVLCCENAWEWFASASL